MIEETSRYYDLTQMQTSDGNDRNVHLTLTLVERLRSAHSIKTDLEEAFVALQYWKKRWEQDSVNGSFDTDSEDGFIASSLLKTAIIAYARAVDGGNEGRVSLPMDKLLSSTDFKNAHGRIISQRHQSIAHHGIEVANVKKWSEQRVILSENLLNKDAKFMFPWTLIRSSKETGADFELCLTAAEPIILSWYEETRKKVIIKLQWLYNNGLFDYLRTNSFNPYLFFTDKLKAENWLVTAQNQNLRFNLKRETASNLKKKSDKKSQS